MTDYAHQYQTYGSPLAGRDETAVMGRRTLAWVIDLAIFLGIVIAVFSSFAEYVDVPSSVGSDACTILQHQDANAASSCFVLQDRAYIMTSAESGTQTLISFGYLAFFIVLQGLAGGSPGKLLTGLRVVDEQGRRAGIGRSLVRTLLWVVDGAPWVLPLVGFIVGLTSTGHRRVGDMAAKTYVVSRRDVGTPVTTAASASPPGQQAWGAPPTSWPPSSPPTAPPSAWSAPASGAGEPAPVNAPTPAPTPAPETPTPFVAPGSEPSAAPAPDPSAAERTPAPEPVPLPPPQWDQARNTYIQWEPNRQAWLQWDASANRWKPIDT